MACPPPNKGARDKKRERVWRCATATDGKSVVWASLCHCDCRESLTVVGGGAWPEEERGLGGAPGWRCVVVIGGERGVGGAMS